MNRCILFSMMISFLLTACASRNNTVAAPPDKQAVFAQVIDYSEIAGCTWILELSDGQKLQPVNLSEEYRRKGMRLFITYKIYDGVSVCMTGKMVTLTSVSVAKEDNR